MLRSKAIRALDEFDKALEELRSEGVTIVVTDHLDIPHHGTAASALIEDLDVFKKLARKSGTVAAMVAYDDRANMLVIYGLTMVDWLYVLYDVHLNVAGSSLRLSGPPQLKEETRKRIREFYQKWSNLMKS
ncbi:hypothetical protein EYM_05055 [Ignicoccus islandicus DSM 13165]|uniref:Uncharacterized protein n=1 Tax=Ignicoccus islandicus DSM 13165 TaxID=940295 RepID=A0A0U3F4R6_9CREN|nr:hypothetical protein [Ignicoccus islandicus]ALU12549.1 hypothetical protein EYM_05055 [Ignicoccus islandicus DSM 13165]